MASFLGSPAFLTLPQPITRASSQAPPPPQPQNQQSPKPPPPLQQLKTTSEAEVQQGEKSSGKSSRSRTNMESTDWIATNLTRRFGLGAGLAWAGFLAFGVISEQIKTRLEVSQEAAQTSVFPMEQTNNIEKKQNLGRRKIDIKKIEDKSSRQVTFTKRRMGLFRKASELCIICGAKIAIIATSQKGKVFTFGHPNVATVINRYKKKEEHNNDYYQRKVEELNLSGIMGKLKYLEAERSHLKELNNKGVVKDENNSNAIGKNNAFWWKKDTRAMVELAELEQFRDSIKGLRNNVRRKTNEMAAMMILTRNSQILR